MDVLLQQTADGGEISFVAGQAVMSDGLETAVYLSLWGGNQNDSGLAADDSKQFWANFIEDAPDARYRGELQALLRSAPIIPINLRRFEDAATNDLAWMVPSIAKSVVVDAIMPAIDTVQIDVSVEVDGTKYNFSQTFTNGSAK